MSRTYTQTSSKEEEVDPNRREEQPQIWHEPSQKVKVRRMGDSQIFAAVDNSGSTGGAIIHDQQNTCAMFAPHLVSLWNSRCEDPVKPDRVRWQSTGGTAPSRIFQNPTVQSEIGQSGVLLFMTDGQVPQSEVTLTSHHTSSVAHLSVICVFTHCGQDPQQIDISVAAPFFANCPNCILLSRYTNDPPGNFRLIKAKGTFSKLEEAPEIDGVNASAWDNFPLVTPVHLSACQIEIREKIPPGYVALGNRFVNLQLLLDSDINIGEIVELIDEHFQQLLLMCKTAGLLPQLRAWLKRHCPRMEDLQLIDNHGEVRLIMLLRRLSLNPDTEPAELASLREQLREARRLNHLDAQEFGEQRRLDLKFAISKIQNAMGQITSMEKTGYGAGILNRLSNRAMRAQRVEDSALEQHADTMVTEGCCQGQSCMICMDDESGSPMCLLIRRVPDVEQNTSDLAIDFPLAFGEAAHNRVICPDVVCYDCAERLGGHSALGREKTEIAIPLVNMGAGGGSNRRIWTDRLARALAGGIKTHNLTQIFFSILQHELLKAGWANGPEHQDMNQMLEYASQEILEHYYTNRTLKDDDMPKVKFSEALVHASQTDHMQHYLLSGVCLIFRTLLKYDLPRPLDNGHSIVLRRVMRRIIARHLFHIKQFGDASQLHNDYREALFQCRFGVPVSGTAQVTSTIENFMTPDDVQTIRDYCEVCQIPFDQFCFGPALSTILFKLLSINHHDSVEHCISVLSLDSMFLEALAHPEQLTEDDIINHMNDAYNLGMFDAGHSPPPQFCSPWGPSVTICSCGFRFLPHGSHGTLEELCQTVILPRRRDHFREVYNAHTQFGNPGLGTKHYNLHRAIRAVGGSFDDPAKTDEEIAQEVIEYIVTQDKRGNIYYPNMLEDTLRVIPSYRQLRSQDNKDLKVTLEDKLEYELRQMEVSNDGLSWRFVCDSEDD